MCFCNCWTARTRSLTHVLCWSPFTCRCLAWICLCWVRQNPRRSNVDGREKGRFQTHFNQNVNRTCSEPGGRHLHPDRLLTLGQCKRYTTSCWWPACYVCWLPLTDSSAGPPVDYFKKKFSGLPTLLPEPSQPTQNTFISFTIIKSKVSFC